MSLEYSSVHDKTKNGRQRMKNMHKDYFVVTKYEFNLAVVQCIRNKKKNLFVGNDVSLFRDESAEI